MLSLAFEELVRNETGDNHPDNAADLKGRNGNTGLLRSEALGSLGHEFRAPVKNGKTDDIDEKVGNRQEPDNRIPENHLPDKDLIMSRRIVLVHRGLRPFQFRQTDGFRRIADGEPHENHTGKTDQGRNPEAPLPGSDVLRSLDDGRICDILSQVAGDPGHNPSI